MALYDILHVDYVFVSKSVTEPKLAGCLKVSEIRTYALETYLRFRAWSALDRVPTMEVYSFPVKVS